MDSAMSITGGDVNLWVRDLPRAKKFYTETIGLAVEEEGERFASLAGELGFRMTIFPIRELNEPTLAAVPPPLDPPTALSTMGRRPTMTADMRTEKLDPLLERIVAAGGAHTQVEVSQGYRMVMFADLEGNVWELIEDPTIQRL